MADIRELYARRVEAASVALGRGDRPEAERLFAEALAMGEENFDATDAALAIPLNELSRLYVRGSEHARAEPLLRRLLSIRRVSGEHSPDVATVLAGLAAARRGLGDDASAEELYRQALEIRETVHAPDHMAVVVTLEHLADTCAANGKVGEARPLLERALAVREKALGAEHPTTRAVRDRLVALIAHAAPSRAVAARPVAAPAVAPVPEELPGPNQLVFIYEPEKPVRRSSARRDRVMTPPFSAAVAAASFITAPAQASPPPRMSAPVELTVTPLVTADPHEFDTAIRPRASSERAAYAPAPRRSQPIAAPVRSEAADRRPKRKSRRLGFAAGGVAVLASTAFFASSRLPGRTAAESAPLASSSEPADALTPAPAARSVALAGAPARLAVARADSVRHPATKQAPTALSPKSTQPDAQAEKVAALPGAPILPVIGSLAIPETNAPNPDSLLRATTTRRDTDADQITSAGRLRAPALAEDRAETSPVLIGVIPPPRFPDALRAQRIEGPVVVQFLVGVDGTVDPASMKVVKSPHELFTESVRNVLPKLHFQPARSADAKPRAEWVQYTIQFTASK